MVSKGDADATTFLEQWVIQDGKPITARLLSILLKVHISSAHKAMTNFFEEMMKRGSEAMPFTLWIIKGQLKSDVAAVSASQKSADSMDVDEEGTRRTSVKDVMLLVAQDKLEETKSTFERIDVEQIYSFSPSLPANHTTAHKVAAASQLTLIPHDIHSKKEYVDVWEGTERGAQLGTIEAAEKWKDSGKSIIPQEAKAGPSKLALPVKKEKKSETVKEEKKPAAEKKSGLDWGKAKSADPVKPKPKAKRKLVESDEEEERRVVDSEEDDNDAGPIGYADADPKASKIKRADAADKVSIVDEKRRKRKQELMDMMDEDGNADPPDIEASEKTTTSMMKGTEEKEDTDKSGKTEAATISEKVPKKRVRKQRKVMKKQTTKDAKGYRKTIDVEEYESYSSDESDATAPASKVAGTTKSAPFKKEAPAMAKTNSGGQSSNNNNAATKKTTAAPQAAGQRKLSSFFKKG